MKKVVLKLDLHNGTEKRRAMKALCSLSGIDSISMDMKEKKCTVTGEVDPVDIVTKLKKNWHVEILSIGPAKELKKEEKKDEPKKSFSLLKSLEFCQIKESPKPYEKAQGQSSDFDSFLQYCINLFPESYEFEMNRTVQLFMAGLSFPDQLEVKQNESIYYRWFRGLIFYEVLQESSSPNCSSDQPKYKLNHSLYHAKHIDKDSSRSSSSSSSSQIHCRIEVDNYDASATTPLPQSTLHASLVLLSSSHHVSANKIFDVFLHNSSNLRTLLLVGQHKSLVDQVPWVLFLKLRDLTVLDLSYTSITELPSSFANLKFLRYLDVSGTPITRLPDSICGFQDMQTLILKDCLELAGLPKELRWLHKLLHLKFDTTASSQITSMPPGIGSLTQLETLPAFIVGKEEDGCGIAELKGMENLKGTLCILKLENVSNSDEATKAALNQKQYLDKLELEWTNYSSSQNGFQVLESLQPHTNINELQIVGYKGAKFPTWFEDPSFINLVTITLYDCACFELFTSLGRLPRLMTLYIGEMRGVKYINREPMDVDRAFPWLNRLALHSLPDLEEWIGPNEGDFRFLHSLKVSSCPKLTTFPELRLLFSLQQLEISCCSQLQSLSLEGSLPFSFKSLLIIDCPILKEQYGEGGEDRSKISNIPNVWID